MPDVAFPSMARQQEGERDAVAVRGAAVGQKLGGATIYRNNGCAAGVASPIARFRCPVACARCAAPALWECEQVRKRAQRHCSHAHNIAAQWARPCVHIAHRQAKAEGELTPQRVEANAHLPATSQGPACSARNDPGPFRAGVGKAGMPKTSPVAAGLGASEGIAQAKALISFAGTQDAIRLHLVLGLVQLSTIIVPRTTTSATVAEASSGSLTNLPAEDLRLLCCS